MKKRLFISLVAACAATAVGLFFSVSPREAANQRLKLACAEVINNVVTDPASVHINKASVGDFGELPYVYSSEAWEYLYNQGIRDHDMTVTVDYTAKNMLGGVGRDVLACKFRERRDNSQLYSSSFGQMSEIVIGNNRYGSKDVLQWLELVSGNSQLSGTYDVRYSWIDRWRYWLSRM